MNIPEEFRQESESSGGSSSANNYCQYTKLSSGESVVFSLLEEDPVFYFTVWGRSKASPNDPTQNRPFRFPKRPTEAEIEEELGSDFIQDVAFEDKHKPVEMQRPRKPNLNWTWPVYNWEAKKVQVLECGHVSTRTGMESIGTHKTWKKMLTDIDIEITKTVTSDNRTTYEVMPSPRDDSHDADEAEAAYKAIKKEGFDLNRMVVGGDPFSEA